MARSTMSSLIQRVRDLASAYHDEYTIGDTAYWDDNQIQAALDRTRNEVIDEVIYPIRQVTSSGSADYRIYNSTYKNFENTTGGTATFYLRTADGARIGTANYTADYEIGRFEFGTTTAGSALYLTGNTYDPYAAAADIWGQKAAHVANRIDFSADGASFKASQMRAQYERMQAQFSSMSTTAGGVTTHTLRRDDINLLP